MACFSLWKVCIWIPKQSFLNVKHLQNIVDFSNESLWHELLIGFGSNLKNHNIHIWNLHHFQFEFLEIFLCKHFNKLITKITLLRLIFLMNYRLCFSICLTLSLRAKKLISQNSHLCGLFFSWTVRICVPRQSFLNVKYLQRWHEYRSFFKWEPLTWTSNRLRLQPRKSQKSHLKSPPFSWMLWLWVCRRYFLVNTLGHLSQANSSVFWCNS